YVGDAAHMLRPDAVRASEALAAAQQDAGVAGLAEPRPADPALGAERNLVAAFERAGFTDVRLLRYERPWAPGEYLAWLSLPVVIAGMCPPDAPGRAPALREALARRMPDDLDLTSVWVLAIARNPAA